MEEPKFSSGFAERPRAHGRSRGLLARAKATSAGVVQTSSPASLLADPSGKRELEETAVSESRRQANNTYLERTLWGIRARTHWKQPDPCAWYLEEQVRRTVRNTA